MNLDCMCRPSLLLCFLFASFFSSFSHGFPALYKHTTGLTDYFTLREFSGPLYVEFSQVQYSIEANAHFCSERLDGFYQHPINCSEVIQCFGGDVFEYPPCDHGLFFDEQQGECNYQDRVKGCSSMRKNVDAGEKEFEQAENIYPTDNCAQFKHGDYIADLTNCSAFYRCISGQFIAGSCPPGTVFNSKLNICDFLDNSIKCKSYN
ncbi:chitin binding peritrophin-A domain-containing protein [Ditylenchus destructor]|uniref:Chitin binding peritrophin-A domain-containing protein n=1 Tax=Ditylenchus destructor TaxID=166010 RepID=A0AAD4NCF9_9BILA|nr:chitin binding peritrophin-A domain-containing protein [Ditylenchus destructor]